MQNAAKCCLIAVPHPEDELGVAGQLIPSLVARGWNVCVLFATNGDHETEQRGTQRMREAIAALNVLGVKEGSVVFLGYGDGWRGAVHLYNAAETVPLTSAAGRCETYGLPEHPEYRMQKSGHHSVYTRVNYKRDLKEAVLETGASVLVCVDFDPHPDHRCLSLMLEEILGEILREQPAYHPIVLKKFTCAGGRTEPRDYFRRPMRETRPPGLRWDNNHALCLEALPHSWETRLRFSVPPETCALRIGKNPVYRAARKYRGRSALLCAERLCNADAVYWPRRTDSLSYRADFSSSSGNPACLRDFKLFDCTDVLHSEPDLFSGCLWIPENKDSEKSVTVTFPEPSLVTCAVLYENFSPADHIRDGVLLFDNGFSVRTGPLRPDGAGTRIPLDPQRNVRSLTFRITEFTGQCPGLTEMEIYGSAEGPDYGAIVPLYAGAGR